MPVGLPRYRIKPFKRKRMKIGGWVELDYDAKVEVAPGVVFYRQSEKQSDSFYQTSHERDCWHWNGPESVAISKYNKDEYFYVYRNSGREQSFENRFTKLEEVLTEMPRFLAKHLFEYMKEHRKKYEAREKELNDAFWLIKSNLPEESQNEVV